MELLQRYLHAVAIYLPRSRRDEIVSALSDELSAELDERAAALGRPLTDADVETILAQHGDPIRVASQYLPQRWLIGPALLPIYLHVLKIVFAVLIGVFFLILLPVNVFEGASPFEAFFDALGDLWFTMWIPVGIVTTIFALLEWAELGAASSWRPERLPRVTESNAISRPGAIATLAVTILFLLWWITGAPFPVPLAVPTLESLYHQSYVYVIALGLCSMLLAAANVLLTYWTPLRLGLQALLDLAFAALAITLLVTNWPTMSSAIAAMSSATTAEQKIDAWTQLNVALGLAIVAVIALGLCALAVRRFVRLRAPTAAAPPSQPSAPSSLADR